MKGQQTYSDIEYSQRKRKTKREVFLGIMNEIIPWDEWIAIIKPYYPSGERGRPPRGIGLMLRMYLLQIWFTLSDEAVEDAIYDIYPMRKFVGINFIDEQVPDATTLLHFRHLIEEHKIAEMLFASINNALEEAGCLMRGGTIADATIINAPKSTKNKEGKRDPEMHQTKKGNEWYHGMKAHVGVDAGSGYVHTVTATAANAHDITETHKLIRHDDEVFYGDAGYQGVEKREEITDNPNVNVKEYKVNRRPGKNRHLPEGYAKEWEKYQERRKSAVRCKVEHVFHIVKDIFGFRTVVYRGLSKNLNRLHMLFMSANLLMCAKSGGFGPHSRIWA